MTYVRSFFTVLSVVAVHTAGAQSFHRRATLTGGGPAGRGQCVVEVIVDGAADVEIRGDEANLTNLSGQPPEFRRFECTSRMPSNPADVRINPQEGRGRVQVLRDPGSGADAVVRIEDPEGGAGRYLFTIDWTAGGPAGFGREGYADRGRDMGRGASFGRDQSIQVCQDAVREQAMQQLNARDIRFNDMNVQDNPGGRDRIIGTFFVARDRDRDQPFQFDCAVNLEMGRVRSVRISRAPQGRYSSNYAGPTNDTVQRCEAGVQERLRRDGFEYVQFGYVNPSEGGWPMDRVSGVARAFRGERAEPFSFSCTVEARDGDIRSVDVRRR